MYTSIYALFVATGGTYDGQSERGQCTTVSTQHRKQICVISRWWLK